ncbi:MAG: hypothetical protein HY817_02855 [Candidatus Abawacabacteria bacterium]|nr:hypothetical protein [Candidatus Abawacabacteria bacterium]
MQQRFAHLRQRQNRSSVEASERTAIALALLLAGATIYNKGCDTSQDTSNTPENNQTQAQ